jgi:type I restriction enzyme S subunit
MWCRRSEFDRNAWFTTDSSVRGGFNWGDFCDLELPVPSIEKQKELIKEYHTITDRIKLNEQLNKKLEDTAQSIYKEWFVNFEFPDENGKPYKSNGGEMVYCDELEMEIPKGWEVISVKNFTVDMKNGGTPSRSIDYYWNSNDIPWLKTGEIENNIIINSEEYISKEGFNNSSAKLFAKETVLMAMYGATAAQVAYLKFETTTNQACCGMICKDVFESTYLYYYLLSNQEEIASMAIGGAQPNLSKTLIEELLILKPTKNILVLHPFYTIINSREVLTREIFKSNELKEVLLSKMATIEG